MSIRLTRTAATFAAIVGVSSLLTSIALAAGANFKTGKYSGTTNQGSKFVAEIDKACDNDTVECFFTATAPDVKTTCPNGESEESVLFTGARISSSGAIKAKLTGGDGTKDFLSAKVSRKGTISGTIKVTHEPDAFDPEAVTGYCSGSATFKLKHG